jgi:hypothetical protein
MSIPARRLADLISTPLEQLIVALGRGIGRSQAELDRHSIEIQRLIDEDAVLSQYGLTASWYRIPTTELNLKVSVAMQGEEPAEGALPRREVVAGIERPMLPEFWIQPVNASFQNQFEYDVQAASTVQLSVVSVTPPGPAAAARPIRTSSEILATARQHLRPTDDLTKPPEGRVTTNFNPGAQAWYAVQSRELPDGRVERLAFVKVDDESLAILRHEP